MAEQPRQQVRESICRNLTVHLTVQDEWHPSSTTLAVAPTYLQTVDIFHSSQNLGTTTILYGHWIAEHYQVVYPSSDTTISISLWQLQDWYRALHLSHTALAGSYTSVLWLAVQGMLGQILFLLRSVIIWSSLAPFPATWSLTTTFRFPLCWCLWTIAERL